MDVRIEKFRDIDLKETFFDSLRHSYKSFDEWFQKKKDAGEEAYVYRNPDNGLILDFLYLKPETEALNEVTPPLPIKKRLKIGTFKVTSRKTRSGEYFLKRALDRALAEDVEECYVTIFPTDDLKLLISRFEAFGFKCVAQKEHSDGRKENVYVRNMREVERGVLNQYPFVRICENKKWLLSIYPDYHTKLFPDSILKTEDPYEVLQDVSETNSIHKVYVCCMRDVWNMQPGDTVIIYRTKDDKGSAAYRSVATSICVVEEIKTSDDFVCFEEFFKYANTYSIFDENQLRMWYNQGRRMTAVKMTYNVAFKRKVINKTLIESVGMNPSYWGFCSVTDEQFKHILQLGAADERYFIN